jgi:hypothetical protein
MIAYLFVGITKDCELPRHSTVKFLFVVLSHMVQLRSRSGWPDWESFRPRARVECLLWAVGFSKLQKDHYFLDFKKKLGQLWQKWLGYFLNIFSKTKLVTLVAFQAVLQFRMNGFFLLSCRVTWLTLIFDHCLKSIVYSFFFFYGPPSVAAGPLVG